MNKEKLKAYKKDLKSPYTGLSQDMTDEIDGKKIKVDEFDGDLNGDGVTDHKDASIAGKTLARYRKNKKVK